MTSFVTPDGILQDLYLRDTDMIDRNIGGRLWVWGFNSNGALGDGVSITHRSSPIQIFGGGTNWKLIGGSMYGRTSSAIKTDGTLWLWGRGTSGQLGDNTIVDKSSPVQTVAGGTNWRQVSCGGTHTVAIKTDGTLWTWGFNSQGQLGDNTSVSKSSPVQTVSAGTNWRQVTCASNQTAAIKTDGTLWLWGRNTNGALGTNDILHRSSPVQTVAGGTNWRLVSCGGYHTAAIKTDGTLWLWGRNTNGHLGDNTIIHRSSPVQTVSGGTNWRQVSCGFDITAAIKTDGTLWLWGRNHSGQIGTNDIIHRSSPVQTVSAGNNWKLVSCGGYMNHAIKTDGTLWTWGSNDVGQLGLNDIIPRSSPVQFMPGSSNWKSVVSGFFVNALTFTD